MADYYTILGLDKQATQADIKSAFRKLAKQYHPDKNPNNPNAKELFGAILKAYETLTDPHKKRRYDLYHSPGGSTAGNTQAGTRTQGRRQKEWTFTEEDLKKRQYYQQYYRQKQKANAQATIPVKPYNDYKYILYATPIAVCLLMLIISLFTHSPDPDPGHPGLAKEPPRAEAAPPKVRTGDQVYAGWFGPVKTYGTSYKLSVNNLSNYDAVAALFDSKTDAPIQHAYVQNGYYVEFSSLPETGVYLRCIIGKYWDPGKATYHNKVLGCFDSIVQVQNWKEEPVKLKGHSGPALLTISRLGGHQHISTGSEELFFKK